MSREDLSAMLTELADGVQPQPQAARAWAKARQVRRRRAVFGAALAVSLISTTINLGRLLDRSPTPTNATSPTATETTVGKARIDQLPATIAAAADAAPYWPAALKNHPGDFVVVVVDDRAKTVAHVLDLGTGRTKLCCAVMGWQGSETVLVRTDQTRTACSAGMCRPER